ncbi:hypothetical protein [Rhodoferax sp. UBA5149]|uniref:hypothetical protein n=1 Tax=Rhodoferax sp. UBA5149 TaxID=1947379 RepID=UPI0025FD0FEA|nr:hypothetical protein [Rhodoferax sp. UBA5149]
MNAFTVDFVRAPFHFARKGKLANLPSDDLAAQVVRAFLAHHSYNGAQSRKPYGKCDTFITPAPAWR